MATGSPGIFPKAEGNIIYAADYNNVQGTANFLLGTGLADSGYGQAITSGQVDSTLKVTAAQWVDLRTDLLKIRQDIYNDWKNDFENTGLSKYRNN